MPRKKASATPKVVTPVANVPEFVKSKVGSVIGEPILFAQGDSVDYYMCLTAYDGTVRYLAVPFNKVNQATGRWFGFVTGPNSNPAKVGQAFNALEPWWNQAVAIAKQQLATIQAQQQATAQAQAIAQAQAQAVAPQAPVAPAPVAPQANASIAGVLAMLKPLATAFPALAGAVAVLETGNVQAFLSVFNAIAPTIPAVAPLTATVTTMLSAPVRS